MIYGFCEKIWTIVVFVNRSHTHVLQNTTLFVSAPKCRDIYSAGIVRRRLGWCMQYAHARTYHVLIWMYVNSQLAIIFSIFAPEFSSLHNLWGLPQGRNLIQILRIATSTSVRDYVRQQNETPKQREERLRAKIPNPTRNG